MHALCESRIEQLRDNEVLCNEYHTLSGIISLITEGLQVCATVFKWPLTILR